jgi:23S rRNA pseudouridine2605 synthase
MPAERLQKIIAAAGVASRRKAEDLIVSGRVVVNGQVVTELGTKADPEQDHIRVDGKLLQGPERYTYVALNKPKGYVTTVSDEKKRPTVMDLVKKVKGRVYPVGRLDWASEGLLLMTNDGALANALMKASSNVAKTYVVKVAGQPDEAKLDKLRRGVSIAEKGGRRVRTAPARIRLIREGDNPWLEVTIIEGRNRQVRKMFEEVGHHVEKIRRVQYGPLALDVPPGDWRNLTLLEVAKLKTAASGPKLALPPSAVAATHTPKVYAPKPERVAKSPNRSRFPRSPKPSRSEKRPRSFKPFGSEKPEFASHSPKGSSFKPSRPPKRERD